MLPLFGDIDVMHYCNIRLVMPRRHPPPTQLPAEFHNYVKVVEIIDSHLPGFVYLELRYLLTQCSVNGKYNYTKYDEGIYISSRNYKSGDSEIHGPAVFTDYSYTLQLPVDTVLCIRCLSWPPQAADWPTRHRNYGWPDSATLDRVVNNGCDVVGVAHRQCRQHKVMGELQWRLSFSRAEIVLINSWMPVQQIVYHLLRYFMKTERLTDCADNSGAGTLSNYHIKTLMLWACELKSRSWWTENLNLVRICVELSETLSVWLTDTRCPHYFVNNCNLLDNSFNVGSVASKLVPVDKEYLSSWLINNYIAQCAKLCPIDISRLFNDVSTSAKLQNVLSQIICWRLNINNSLYDMWRAVSVTERVIVERVSHYAIAVELSERQSLSARSCVCWMNELAKTDHRFSIYFSAVVLLHVARKMSRDSCNNELMDVLDLILESCNVLPQRRAELSTSELVEVLQKSAVAQLTTYRQLIAPDLCSIVTIVATDFEATYAYNRDDYQRCLHLSTQNVQTLLDAQRMPDVLSFPEFIQLLDDDIVSLTALTVIINPRCRYYCNYFGITQLTLSLYLMTQCQLKLHHSVTSLAHTLHYIKVAQSRHPRERILEQLTLKFIERKVLLTISR